MVVLEKKDKSFKRDASIVHMCYVSARKSEV